MRSSHSTILTRVFAVMCMALTLLGSAEKARANYLDDVIAMIDATHQLPFSLAQWKSIYETCANSDDLVACVDTAGAASGVKDQDTELAFKIFADLENKDYWQLLADGGTVVACAAAKILTGIDVCNILGALYDGAKEIVDWFSGLFGGGNSYTPNIGQTSAYPCSPPMTLQPGPGGTQVCSYCPLGQAKINGVCGFCPGPTQSVTQSPDKMCWTTSGTTQGTPMVDGSSCNGGGYTNAPVCCKPGSISPAPGVCAPACAPGQVFDTAAGACKACGTDAKPYYDHPNSSVGKCTCPPFGGLELDANNNCVQGCPVGSTKNPNGSCSPSCAPGQVYDKDNHYCHACSAGTLPSYFYGPQSSAGDCAACYNGSVLQNGACICPAGSFTEPGPRAVCQTCAANTYSPHPGATACAPCADNEVSTEGSPGCHVLKCGPLMHAQNHKCVSLVTRPSDTTTRALQRTVTPQCPRRATWTGQVCVGPRGKHFCPEGMALRGDVCVATAR